MTAAHDFRFVTAARMSFLKFWAKKSKKEEDIKVDPTADPELEKRRLRHSLSISRSGRFKQKKRERSQISDKPELFVEPADSCSDVRHDKQPTTRQHQPSPKGCRDVNTPGATGNIQVLT